MSEDKPQMDAAARASAILLEALLRGAAGGPAVSGDNDEPTRQVVSMEPDHGNAMLEVLESMEPMIELCDGYRSKLLAHGYSETAAEQMTVEFHWKLMSTPS